MRLEQLETVRPFFLRLAGSAVAGELVYIFAPPPFAKRGVITLLLLFILHADRAGPLTGKRCACARDSGRRFYDSLFSRRDYSALRRRHSGIASAVANGW